MKVRIMFLLSLSLSLYSCNYDRPIAAWLTRDGSGRPPAIKLNCYAVRDTDYKLISYKCFVGRKLYRISLYRWLEDNETCGRYYRKEPDNEQICEWVVWLGRPLSSGGPEYSCDNLCVNRKQKILGIY